MARRTLDRPPSERYGANAGGEVVGHGTVRPPTPSPGDATPTRRPVIGAGVAAAATAAALVAVGGLLGSTTGLLFVAGVGGALVGLLLAASPRSRERLHWLAIGLAVGAVVVGAFGTWLVALDEGGALGLLDFLWATSGLLVPAEVAVAAVAAAWGLRAGPIRP